MAMDYQPAIPIIRKMFTGLLPDVINEPSIQIDQNKHLQVGQVGESTKSFYSCGNAQISRMDKLVQVCGEAIPRVARGEMATTELDLLIYNNSRQDATIDLISEVQWESTFNDIPILSAFAGNFSLHKGWYICVEKSLNLIPPNEPLFPADHINRRFFGMLSGMFRGDIYYDGNPPLLPLQNGEKIAGKLEDTMFQQFIFLASKLLKVINQLTPSSDPLTCEQIIQGMTVKAHRRLQQREFRLSRQRDFLLRIVEEHINELASGKLGKDCIEAPDGTEGFALREDWNLVFVKATQ